LGVTADTKSTHRLLIKLARSSTSNRPAEIPAFA
jgi:hypothetical protein